MLKLSAKMPFDDLLPLSIGTVTLSDDTPDYMSIIDCPWEQRLCLRFVRSWYGASRGEPNYGECEKPLYWFGKNHILLGPNRTMC